jgi:hypothetical protein
MLSIAPSRSWMGVLLVGLITFAGIVLILALVHASAEHTGTRCFAPGLAGFKHAQWPKWIGCAIATHESFAAGLFGSATALSAVLIALQQIKDARQKSQAAEERREKREQDREKREELRERRERAREQLELVNIKRVVNYYCRLLQPFDEAQGTDDIKYINGLHELKKTGDLSLFIGPLPAELRHPVRDAFERLRRYNNALEKLAKKGGGSDTKVRSQINDNIHSMVIKIHERRDEARECLANRMSLVGQ